MSGAIATAAIIGGIGAAGSIGGAAIASSGAKSAAKTQSQAADQAAQLQYQASQNALDFQKQQYNDTQQNALPWLRSGTGAISNLDYLMGIGPMTSQQFQLGGGMSLPSQPEMGGRTSLDQPLPGQPAPSGGPNFSGGIMPMSSPSSGAIGAGGPTLAGAGTSPLGFGNPSANPVSGGASLAGAGSSLSPWGNGNPSANPVSGAPGTLSGPYSLGGGGNPGAGAVGAGGPSLAGGGSAAPSSGGYGSLMQGYGQQFVAPQLNESTDPGYQARLALGTDAVQRSAAARGNLLTGGTAQALNQFGQDYASNEYGNVYNRALQGFGTNYNVWSNDQANQFNRLAALSGVGQTAANQLSVAGQNASNNISSNLLGTAAQMGQQYNNAAAANASGVVGSANAWGGALGGIGNNLSNLYMLRQLQNTYGGGASGGTGGA